MHLTMTIIIVYEVPSDGDCMYSSIALGLGSPHTAESVRNDVVNSLQNHRDEVDELPLQEVLNGRMLEGSASNLSDVANFSLANDNYLQRMTKPGEWTPDENVMGGVA
jgi:OTU-like cysteine protease